MSFKCVCVLNMKDLEPVKGPSFRKVICEKCGREIFTDIEGKTMCFECEKPGGRSACADEKKSPCCTG
jgi:hypothetical protein